MTDVTEMPQYDGMEYENLVTAAQFLWMEKADLREVLRYADDKNVHLRDAVYEERVHVKRLKAENAKLREALAYAFKTECDGRPTECETCKLQCPFSRIGVLMDELGIEVD